MKYIITILLILFCPFLSSGQTIVSDDFSGGSLDASKWNVGTLLWPSFQSPTITVTQTGDGLLRINPPSALPGLVINGITSVPAGAFTRGRAKVKLSNFIIKELNFNALAYFAVIKDPNNCFYAAMEGAVLTFHSVQGGVSSVALMNRNWDFARDRYLQIQNHVADNAIVLYTSQTGTDWNEFGRFSLTANISTTDYHVEVSAGVSNVTGPNSVIVDSIVFDQPIIANAGNDSTIIVGGSKQLDCSASLGNAITYSTTQISGPSSATITNPTNAKPNIGTTIKGQYRFRCSVNDGVTTSTDDVDIGSVEADTKGKVIITDPGIDFIVFPLIAYGSDKTPSGAWYDYVTDRELWLWGTSYPGIPPVHSKIGTVNVTNGSKIVTCNTSNCNFTTEIEMDELVSKEMRSGIVINDAGTDRSVLVASVDTNDQLTLVNNWAFTTQTGRVWGNNFIYPGNAIPASSFLQEASRYDLAEQIRKQADRTGLTKWMTLYRKVADSRIRGYFYENFCDCVPGPDQQPEFYAEYMGMIIRAIDGRPELWDFLYRKIKFFYDQGVYLSKDARQRVAQMTNGGTGYSSTSPPSCTITTTGAGTGATCHINSDVEGGGLGDVVSGIITKIRITNQGLLYNSITSPPIIVISGGGGSGGAAIVGVDDATGKVIGINSLIYARDTRNAGYNQSWASALYKTLPDTYTNYANGVDQASTGTTTDGAAKRAILLTEIEEGARDWFGGNINSSVNPSISPDGSFRWDIDKPPPDGRYRYNQPYMDGITQQGLIFTYRATSNSAIKTSIFNTIKASVDWTYYACGYNQTITNFSPKKWKTCTYDGHGGTADNPLIFEPPWTYGPANSGSLLEVTNARGLNGFMAGPAAWVYYISKDVTYRNIADEHWSALFAANGETYSGSGIVGDGIYGIGTSPQKESSKSKEATEPLYGTTMAPVYRQGSDMRCNWNMSPICQ